MRRSVEGSWYASHSVSLSLEFSSPNPTSRPSHTHSANSTIQTPRPSHPSRHVYPSQTGTYLQHTFKQQHTSFYGDLKTRACEIDAERSQCWLPQPDDGTIHCPRICRIVPIVFHIRTRNRVRGVITGSVTVRRDGCEHSPSLPPASAPVVRPDSITSNRLVVGRLLRYLLESHRGPSCLSLCCSSQSSNIDC